MKREKPSILVRKTKRGLVPVSAFDEERLSALPLNTEFEIKPLTRRSLIQLRLYWQVLGHVVAATEIAPTPEHLHESIKIALGYVTLMRLLDGRLYEVPDSAALDAMTHEDFQRFYEAAMKLLAERIGYDPTEALERRAA